jgi:hypothetical protein
MDCRFVAQFAARKIRSEAELDDDFEDSKAEEKGSGIAASNRESVAIG